MQIRSITNSHKNLQHKFAHENVCKSSYIYKCISTCYVKFRGIIEKENLKEKTDTRVVAQRQLVLYVYISKNFTDR